MTGEKTYQVLIKPVRFFKEAFQMVENKLTFYQFSARFSKYKETIRLNGKLRGSGKGKRCFILGNGPSLKGINLAALRNEDTFVTNSFFYHPQYAELNPKYYVFADPLMKEIQRENVKIWWQDLARHTEGSVTTFLLPIELKDGVVDKEILGKREKNFLALALPFNRYTAEIFDPTGPVHGVQNVVGLALQLALYMGYKEIILMGVEHGWLSEFRVNAHFYKADVAIMKESTNLQKPYWWLLEAVSEMFRQYRVIDSIAKKKGVTIINATGAGVLDVFPMTTPDTILNQEGNLITQPDE